MPVGQPRRRRVRIHLRTATAAPPEAATTTLSTRACRCADARRAAASRSSAASRGTAATTLRLQREGSDAEEHCGRYREPRPNELLCPHEPNPFLISLGRRTGCLDAVGNRNDDVDLTDLGHL